jgi:hypothetical protein
MDDQYCDTESFTFFPDKDSLTLTERRSSCITGCYAHFLGLLIMAPFFGGFSKASSAEIRSKLSF